MSKFWFSLRKATKRSSFECTWKMRIFVTISLAFLNQWMGGMLLLGGLFSPTSLTTLNFFIFWAWNPNQNKVGSQLVKSKLETCNWTILEGRENGAHKFSQKQILNRTLSLIRQGSKCQKISITWVKTYFSRHFISLWKKAIKWNVCLDFTSIYLCNESKWKKWKHLCFSL